MGLHKNITESDNHIVISGTFADETARLAFSPVATDVGRAYQQTSPNNDIYVLLNHSPTTWSGALGTGSGETNLAANVGTGQGEIFRDKTGVTLNFKKLVQGSNVTITNGTDTITIASTGGGGSADLLEYIICEHFASGNMDLDEIGKYGWRTFTSGTGTAAFLTSEAGHPGVIELQAGTGSATVSAIYIGDTTHPWIKIGGTNQIEFEALIKVTGSIQSSDLEMVLAGLSDNFTTDGKPDDGIYVLFDANTGTFAIESANNGTRTTQQGTTSFGLNNWYRVGFVISDPSGTPSIQLKINGSNEGSPITTNIPTTGLGIGVKADSAGGSVEPVAFVDYITLKQISDKED